MPPRRKDKDDEPRRSIRTTRGQHKNASSSPAPAPAPNPKAGRPAKGKPTKKSVPRATTGDAADGQGGNGDDDEGIRCICGDNDENSSRAFIFCDACSKWQHNVCMGMTDVADDLEDHYFCEKCQPGEHVETVQALQRGEKIWETRDKIYHNEKKMSKSRKGNRKSGEAVQPAWLKKDTPLAEHTDEPAEEQETTSAQSPVQGAETETIVSGETNNKRKREDRTDHHLEAKADPEEEEPKPNQRSRQDKRQKSVSSKTAVDTSTALVDIEQLPADRKKVAQALSKIIGDDVAQRVKSGFQLPGDHTAKSLGDHHAGRVEYALFMNHGTPKESGYTAQFRALNANLKKNNVLVQRLLDGSLTADELSTMPTSEMASEDLQRERAAMKETLDRQALALQEDGPKYKHDHKGIQLVEDENQHHGNDHAHVPSKIAEEPRAPETQPVPQAASGSPMHVDPEPAVASPTAQDTTVDRRASSQQFDMNNIWSKTAQSPSLPTPPGASGMRPMQMPARRPSLMQSVQNTQNGANVDPDIDRLLDDNDESYSPAEASGPEAIVWRGKIQQYSEEAAPIVNARLVAGRDLAPTIAWQEFFPETLVIDGRIATAKAEDYLCGLRWSTTSDVCVLALRPHDNAEAFNHVFEYFHSRKRYAVVAGGKPKIVKDLYMIPVEVGGEIPDHVDMLEPCNIKKPIEERLLLMTLVVARSPDSPSAGTPTQAHPTNGNLPQHLRQSIGGPAGSPLNVQNPLFGNLPPPQSQPPPQAGPGYGAPNSLPPNPYAAPGFPPQQYQQAQPYQPPPQAYDQRIGEILGPLQYAPTAQQILQSSNGMLTEKQLYHLHKILSEDPNARTDFVLLSRALGIA